MSLPITKSSLKRSGLPGVSSGSPASGEKYFAIIAVLPVVLIVALVMVYPIVDTVYHSFTFWNGVSTHFTGLKNYSLLLHNSNARRVFLNSLLFLISVPLIILASLIPAVLIYEHVWGWKVFRSLFFIPTVLSTVVVGLLFSSFFATGGAVDAIFKSLGLPSTQWLAHGWSAFVVIVLAVVWQSFGFGMVVILAGLSNIDPSIYDAAVIDGVSWWRKLISITIPLLRGPIQFVSVTNVVYTFTSLFGFVFVITGGGPGFDTTTIDYYTYLNAFENGNMGYGAATAVVLFLVVLLLTVVQLKVFKPDATE